MDQITIKEVVSPYTADFKEAMFYCRIMFGFDEDEIDQLTKQLKMSKSIYPNKIHLLVAKKGKIFVGFTVVYYLNNRNMAYMEYIGVLPQFQGMGIGSTLYHYALNILHSDNCEVKGMLYEVNRDREGFIARTKFFANLGAMQLNVTEVEMFKDYKVLLFYHPLNRKWTLSSNQVPQVMLDLCNILV